MSKKKDKTPSVTRDPRASRSEGRKKFDRDNYRRPNDLRFPKALKEYFEKDGYYLYWVAVVDAKTQEYTNARLNHFLGLGGDLVTPSEIKGIDPAFLSGLTKYTYQEEWADESDEESRNSLGGIKKDHLVLVKIPLEYKEYRQESNRELVQDQLATAQQDYKKNSDAFVKNFDHGSSNLKMKSEFFSKD